MLVLFLQLRLKFIKITLNSLFLIKNNFKLENKILFYWNS